MTEDAKEPSAEARGVCSNIFILSVGACPTLRDAGRDDVANALGSCVAALPGEVQAAIDTAVQAERERTRKLIEGQIKGLERQRTTVPTRRGGVPDNTRVNIKVDAIRDLLAAISPTGDKP